MQRTVNLVIGLAVVTGISIVLLGSIGGKGTSKRSSGDAPPSSGPRGGLPQLDVATGIVGPTSSPPPPIPETAHVTPPAAVVDARWERARQRLRRVFGGSLSTEQEAAVQAAVATWVAMELRAVEAYQGGYIDQRTLGLHRGWNRNVYMLALQDALGNERFQRYARLAHEEDELDELDELDDLDEQDELDPL